MAVDNQAAQTATSALQAIPFGTLIGAPLDACIKAQAQAAQTSWEFIRNVGLTTDPDTGETKAINVSFQYNKNGEMVNLVVPLLTIVPIPFLAINSVIIDFLANISASSSSVNETSSSEDISAGGSARGSFGYGPFSVSFEASANYSSKKDSKASQQSAYSVEYTMNVHVEGGQADMPAGLATVLNILQSAVTEAPTGGGVALSPQNPTLPGKIDAKIYIEATAKDSQGVKQKNAPIKFTISGTPTGMTLNNIEVTRGTAVGQPTASSADTTADEQGISGIVISVSALKAEYKAGMMTLDTMATVTAPPDKQQSASTVDVSTQTKIRTLPTPAPLPGSATLSNSAPDPLELAGQTKDVELTLLDGNGTPIPNQTITGQSDKTEVVDFTGQGVSPQTTDNSGKVKFKVKKGANAQSGDTAVLSFAAQGIAASSTVNVKIQ